MPLTSNVYHVGQGINTISRHGRCDHASSHIDSREPYPALCTLVEHLEGVSRDADELDEWYHSDALFRFAIAAHSDRVIQMDCLDTGGRGGITQGVSFEFFESFLSIYSHNTH